MRGLEEGRFAMNAGTVKHLDLCLGCLACESACPSGVQYGALLEETREHLDRHYVRGWARRIFERVILEGLLPFPRRLALALMPVRLLCGVGLGRLLPSWLRETMGVTKERRGRPALTTFHPTTAGTCRGRVGLVSGCVMSVLFKRTNAATVALLNHAGYDVVIPPSQGCCGALHLHRGGREAAEGFARRNLSGFGSEALDAVIINAAGCGSTLKEYGRLLAGDPEWAEQARVFSSRVRDLSEFLAGVPEFAEQLGKADSQGGKVAFHDACHLAHAQAYRAGTARVAAGCGRRSVGADGGVGRLLWWGGQLFSDATWDGGAVAGPEDRERAGGGGRDGGHDQSGLLDADPGWIAAAWRERGACGAHRGLPVGACPQSRGVGVKEWEGSVMRRGCGMRINRMRSEGPAGVENRGKGLRRWRQRLAAAVLCAWVSGLGSEPPPSDIVPHAGLTAKEAVGAATLPPGFAMHVFAAEPEVRQPIAFALDHRGRVWVAEGLCYPKRRAEGQGIDRILVFEDSDGDHQFDRRVVFMEGLNLVSGLEVGFGGVWIGAAPHLMFVPVADWDNPRPAGEAADPVRRMGL
jgi:Fe-S oxidoreductase